MRGNSTRDVGIRRTNAQDSSVARIRVITKEERRQNIGVHVTTRINVSGGSTVGVKLAFDG